ncbi:DUF262 domain-containing protein [Mycetocola zhadangensis]|uniref:DUF262 domain-containing protein n=1 Tax=Mycetocola zhadangensis TaxID=1164595 RepID=A0A3L7J0U7_9MICO|nr:DUF262 domain-containing protein [Mycetocola zhadangensis]RLQ84108.1 DUF262 domain-containing protein [Mycetocola zhadangensis]GGE96109.1 hypothetical protein GCM10011313_18820 [Mycetocola zhadangensis]
MSSGEFLNSDDATDSAVDDETEADDLGLFETAASSLPYFGADFDVAGLVRRLEDEDILVPRFDPDESEDLTIEGFQRQRVWTAPRMEKFIESLLLGWPVPSIFLVVEPDGRYLVLDGQQRLTTLQNFYSGTHLDGRPFVLTEVAEHLQNATYATLSKESQRRLNNTFIQAVVIEPAGEDGRDAVYRLFGRLNSGGVSLTAQEIRVALYRGPLVEFIRDLNHDPSWRHLFGAPHKKLKDHELILRALSMSDVIGKVAERWEDDDLRLTAYKPPMAQFLNHFLETHGDLASLAPNVAEAFGASCRLLVDAGGRDGLKFAGRLNAAHIDALLGALISAHLNGNAVTATQVKTAVAALRNDPQYVDWVSRSTSHRDSVFGRLRTAYESLKV